MRAPQALMDTATGWSRITEISTALGTAGTARLALGIRAGHVAIGAEHAASTLRRMHGMAAGRTLQRPQPPRHGLDLGVSASRAGDGAVGEEGHGENMGARGMGDRSYRKHRLRAPRQPGGGVSWAYLCCRPARPACAWRHPPGAASAACPSLPPPPKNWSGQLARKRTPLTATAPPAERTPQADAIAQTRGRDDSHASAIPEAWSNPVAPTNPSA